MQMFTQFGMPKEQSYLLCTIAPAYMSVYMPVNGEYAFTHLHTRIHTLMCTHLSMFAQEIEVLSVYEEEEETLFGCNSHFKVQSCV